MSDSPEIRSNLYEELERLARSRSIDNYKEVADRCQLDKQGVFFGPLSKMLTAINEREFAERRPLLAAVVVNKKLKRPGAGFFKWMHEHGLCQGNEKECWKEELERVFDYWAKHE